MSSLGASETSEPVAPALVRYLDVVLIVVAAPIMIAIGVSATGYAIGAGAWIALRAAGEVLERNQALHANFRTEVNVRLAFMLSRLFLLAIAVILARSNAGRDAGLTALVVVAVAFTVQLAVSAMTRIGTKP
jgi:hypothetical protein